jgi:DNA segregation ATPase FtsK/SpoIIIE-like protein
MEGSTERLTHRIEVQSTQIEAVLDRNDLAAEIETSQVNSDWVHYNLGTQLANKMERFKHMGRDLTRALGVPEVRLLRRNGRLKIAVKRSQVHPVDLLDLMASQNDSAPYTATLGLDHAERPVLLDLAGKEMGNILVAGCQGAGKSALLRTIAVSLALQNRQSDIQLIILDADKNGASRSSRSVLYPLTYLPHMLFPVIDSFEESKDVLDFLTEEIAYRKEQGVIRPLITVMIDDVNSLMRIGGVTFYESLVTLLQDSNKVGVRVIMGASGPSAEEVQTLLRLNVPIRLVGRLEDAKQARIAAGIPDSQAEYLIGKGDYIAVSQGNMVPFQAAFIDDYDLHLTISTLQRNGCPTLLAQPINQWEVVEEETDIASVFHPEDESPEASVDPNGMVLIDNSESLSGELSVKALDEWLEDSEPSADELDGAPWLEIEPISIELDAENVRLEQKVEVNKDEVVNQRRKVVVVKRPS